MDRSDRRARIRANLGIEPISHGQVHTFQIAIPDSQKQEISLKRRQVLEDSLTEYKTNLVPVIVRHTEAYSEEEEYEVVYGADWCFVAKELDIERLWVWVFDMSDEQAAATKAEMEQLAGVSLSDQKIEPEQPKQVTENRAETETIDIERLLDKKLQPLHSQLNQLLSKPASSAGNSFEGKLSDIENTISHLTSTVDQLAEAVQKLIVPPANFAPTAAKLTPTAAKIDLQLATREDVDKALEEVGASSKQRQAAWKAIEKWKASPQGLNWRNLQKSTKKGKDKIPDFADATYEKLKKVADISV